MSTLFLICRPYTAKLSGGNQNIVVFRPHIYIEIIIMPSPHSFIRIITMPGLHSFIEYGGNIKRHAGFWRHARCLFFAFFKNNFVGHNKPKLLPCNLFYVSVACIIFFFVCKLNILLPGGFNLRFEAFAPFRQLFKHSPPVCNAGSYRNNKCQQKIYPEFMRIWFFIFRFLCFLHVFSRRAFLPQKQTYCAQSFLSIFLHII